MIEIFQYDFMVRAFTAGIIIGAIAPLIGTFLVARRYALIADTLSHVSLAGVAIGLLTGIYPVYTALVTALIAALIIERLRATKRLSGETALAIFLSGGLAVAITLIGIANGFSVDIFGYLFGSITTVQTTDVWVIGILGVAVLVTLILLYKELFFISFDEESARVGGIPVTFLNNILMGITAVTVALSMRIVGVLLVGALMVIPVVASMQIARNFKQSIAISMAMGICCVIAGLFAAYYINIPAGGAIVLTAIAMLAITMITKNIKV